MEGPRKIRRERVAQTSPKLAASGSAVSLFKFNAQDIRVVTLDGAPWFVASDVMKLLYGRTSGHNERYAALSTADMLKGHPSKFGLGLGRHVMLVTEQGLYKLVFESRKPEAVEFKNWIAEVVLPSIRKDGGYVLGEEKVATGELSEDELVLKVMQMQAAKVERLKAERDAALKAQALAELARYLETSKSVTCGSSGSPAGASRGHHKPLDRAK